MIDPTPNQIAVRDSEGLSMVIIAPAGCGKTEALALRVSGLIHRQAVKPPRRILVATFSNRARDNLKARLADYLSATAIRDRVSVMNFHGLAARVVRAHGAMIGISNEWSLPDSDWVGEQCRRRGLTFKDADITQGILRTTKLTALNDSAVTDALMASENEAAREIEALRRSERRLTYDDLPRLAEIILAHDAIADLYRNHFGAVVVDEFQDLTPQQLRIVNRIGAGRTTYAGDLAQGIYRFTGAEPSEVYSQIRLECSEEVVMAESHRSSPAVLNMVNALAHRTGSAVLSSADPDSWPAGGLGGRIGFSSTTAEANWVVSFASGVLQRTPEHRIGVMSRTTGRRRFVDAAFADSGIAHFRWEDGILDTGTAAAVRTMLSRLDPAEYAASSDSAAFLRDLAQADKVQDPDSRHALADALEWCNDALSSGSSREDLLARIRVGDATTLLSVPGVHLLNGHLGKGQQFDWVIIVGAEDGSLPMFLANTKEDLEEEARILGVMLSRARHGAVILHSASVEAATSGIPYAKKPSPFLVDLHGVADCRDAVGINQWLESAPWAQIVRR